MMTELEYKSRQNRSYKLLLLFAMISMTMMFAGLTSAFVVSKSRRDWLSNFEIPAAFFYSLIAIVLCSATIHFAKKAIQKNDRKTTSVLLLATLGLGTFFVFSQLHGFQVFFQNGLVPVGPSSKITITFFYVIVMVHLAHLAGGIISLLVIIYNHFKQRYTASNYIGIELGAMYWHFLDLLWIYLFCFIYFFK